MGTIRRYWLLAALLGFGSCVHAQQLSTPPTLGQELCACLTRIDQAVDDQRFNAQVTRCLEDAVVHHPGEVVDLLQRYPQRNNKAYVLGLILGGTLDEGCAGFAVVKARMQQSDPYRIRKGT